MVKSCWESKERKPYQKAVTLEKLEAEIITLKEIMAEENWQIRRARLLKVPGKTWICMSRNLHH